MFARCSASLPLLVALVVAFVPVFPAHAGVHSGTPVPAEAGPIRARADQASPQAAFNTSSGTTLVVWEDTRNGTKDVYATRVTTAGIVLDTNGIPIAASAGDESEPAVACDGTNWLVVFRDGTTSSDIRGHRVAADGVLLDATPLAISVTPGRQYHPSASWNGSLYIVVSASDSAGTTKLRGTTVTSAGAVLNGGAGSILTLLHGDMPFIAGPDTALVAYQTNRSGNLDVYAMRVRGQANAANPVVRIGAEIPLNGNTTEQSQPHVAAYSGGWLVVWQDLRIPANGVDIRGTRVSRNGGVLDDATLAIGLASADDRRPAAYYNGTDWVVSWALNSSEERVRRVTTGGVLPDPPITIENLPSRVLEGGAFGSTGLKPLVLYVIDFGDHLDVVARQVDADLAFLDLEIISTQTPNQTKPAVVQGNRQWLVAWEDDRTGRTQIRVGWTTGSTLTTLTGFQWVDEDTSRTQTGPAVAFDGTNYYVFYRTQVVPPEIRAAVYDGATHARLALLTVVSGSPIGRPACTSVGDLVIAAWSDARDDDAEIWGRVLQDGALLSNEFLISEDAVMVNDVEPSLAPSLLGGDAVCAFQRNGSPTSIMGARLSNLLQPTPTAAVFPIEVAVGSLQVRSPSIAFNGLRNLVAWLAFNPSSVDYQVTVRVLDGASGPAPLGAFSDTEARPWVADAGYDWAIAWSSDAGGNPDILGAAMDGTNGNSRDGAGVSIAAQAQGESNPVLARGAADSLGGAFQRLEAAAPWINERVWVFAGHDSLVAQVVINEFHVNPPSGRSEFYELLNKSGRTLDLKGWILFSNSRTDTIRCVPPSTCVVSLPAAGYYVDSTLTSTGSPDGFFPNRHARLRLFTPAGVLVDQVAYGDSGGATVSSALPRSYFLSTIGPIETHSVAGAVPTLGGEDSVIVTTSRLPDGTDTDNDAQDFGLSLGGTTGNVNVGVPSAPGTGLFFTRVYSYGLANDAVELYNPDAHQTIDFTGWFLSNGEFTQPIGIEGNVWSELEPFEKRILRRNEPGAFMFGLEYDTQLALYKPDLQRVEQIAWWRDDLAWPDSCMTRSPETGGFHDGHDWVSSGGDLANYTLGPVRYEPCTINAPQVDAGETRHAVAFAGAVPNPATSSSGAQFAFTVPGVEGGDRVQVRLTLYNVAGRRVRDVVDHALAPGEHRARLPRVDGGGRTLAAGVYFAELEIGNARVHRNVVLLP